MKTLVAFLVGNRSASMAAVLLACAVTYGNSVRGSFHYDDLHSIVENPHIRSLSAVPSFFWQPEKFSRDADKAMYRPLLLASLALNYAVGAYDTLSYHILNIVLHGACSLLLWALLGRLGVHPCMALGGGLVFAVHPLASEPVNYISSRSELMAALGVLGTVWMHAVAASDPDTGARWRRGSVLCFAAGLLSKSTAMVALPLIVGWDWATSSRVSRRAYAPYVVCAGAYLAFSREFIGKALIADPVRGVWLQLGTQVKATVFYIHIMLAPVNLSVSHAFSEATVTDGAALLSLVALISLALLVVGGRRAQPAVALGVLWMAIVSLPTAVIPLNVLVNEHRLYLPMAGLMIALAGLRDIESVRGMLKGVPLLLAVLLALTASRNAVWANEWTLWRDAAEKAPRDSKPLVYMANYAKNDGDLPAAVSLFERALALEPRNTAARNNLANTYKEMQRWPQAIALYESIVRDLPDYGDARYNLAVAYHGAGDLAAARSHYVAVDSGGFHFGLTLGNLGAIHEQEGRLDSAVAYYVRAVGHPGSAAEAGDNLRRIQARLPAYARALIDSGEARRLQSVCRQLLLLAPTDREVLFYFGVSLFLTGDFEESLRHHRALLQAHPEDGEGYIQLANVLETTVRLEEAAQAYAELIRRRPDAELAEVARQRLRKLREKIGKR